MKHSNKKTSPHKGVAKYYGRWKAIHFHKGQRKSLGIFDTEEEAKKAYDDFVRNWQEPKPIPFKKRHLCACCFIEVVDEFLNLKDPDRYIIVNKSKAYFCGEDCLEFYVSDPLTNKVYKARGRL